MERDKCLKKPTQVRACSANLVAELYHHRRRFLSNAATTIGAVELVMIGSADSQSSQTNPADATTIKSGTNTSFGLLKQIDARVLGVGYAEAGTADGPTVILLHGWLYDIHSSVDVAPFATCRRRAEQCSRRLGREVR